MSTDEVFEGAPTGDFKAEFPVPGDLVKSIKAAAWCTSSDEGHNMVHLLASGDEVTAYGSSPLSIGAATCEANVVNEGVVSLTVGVAREIATIVKNWADRAEPPTTTLEASGERIHLVIAQPADLYGRRVHQTSRPRVVGAEPAVDVPAVLGDIISTRYPSGAVRLSPDQSNKLRQIAQMAKENLTFHGIDGEEGRSVVQIEGWFTGTVTCRKEEHHANTDAPADVSGLPEVEAGHSFAAGTPAEEILDAVSFDDDSDEGDGQPNQVTFTPPRNPT